MIGLMGSGKSTAGCLLASAIGCRYVDNDESIATLAGRSTVDLAAVGPELLHAWESAYVHMVADLDAPLVAGIPASIAERADDLGLLNRQGLLVYLRADTDTLAARVAADQPRPLLGEAARASLAEMFAVRDPLLVASAFVALDATRSPEAIVRDILALI